MLKLVNLGDQAALAYFANETAALSFAEAVRRANPPWLVDVVQAYASTAIFFDLGRTCYAEVETWLRQLKPLPADTSAGRSHVIPCCYEFQLDFARIEREKAISAEEIIRLHATTEFTVYAIGFCPGFPYMGYLPPDLSGVPRLEKPRVRLEAGSVGLTGRQTGIYTEPRPGGWNIIGRTPLELVNVADGYFPLRVGDRVQFQRIGRAEFSKLEGERLQIKENE
jgi:inhibitor of KinA